MTQNFVAQVTLKDFQTTMKVAKGREAATLPKQSRSAAVPAELDLEQGEDNTEKLALLQVPETSLLCLSFSVHVLETGCPDTCWARPP